MTVTKKKTTKKKAPAKKRSSSTTKTQLGDKSLVIVESPTKARTLTKYLGRSYIVKSTVGHIIDLPGKRIGVDIENGFAPEYVPLPRKSKVIKDLVSAAIVSKDVLLATDPDREGEAIAWHVSNQIQSKVKNISRVEFHELTKNAVQKAVKSPGSINMKLVDAQQARRVMDRLVGYQVSPLLWKTISKGLSAGRVQSVALRQICEREEEIEKFVKEEFWTIDGLFKGDNVDEFSARLHKLDKKKVQIPDQKSSESIVDRIKKAAYKVDDIRKSRKKRRPYPPYITSTLQQDAGRRLYFPTKKAMSVAQQLYEGIKIGNRGQVGLITYMRTDSIRVSNEAISDARNWIGENLGSSYLPGSPRIFKNKKGAIQDAHEAIRPTDVSLTPDSIKGDLTSEQYKLYNLIWRRFVASQMKEAEVDVTVITIGGYEGKQSAALIEFRVSGQVMVFPGFLAVYKEHKANSKTSKNDNDKPLPVGIEEGMALELLGLDLKQHFTQPPPRFNEARLVKELDDLGIGRPSTYASIISTLLDRTYVIKQEKALLPTDLGKTVNTLLVSQFPDVFNVEFTSQMEEALDRVELGSSWQDVVGEFYKPFSKALDTALENRVSIKKKMMEPVGRKCPDCGAELVYRWSKRGRFISCSDFPDCKHAESLEPTPTVSSDIKCPKCNGPMVVRHGRYGTFLGCSNYPKCRGILPLKSDFACPTEGCDGKLVKRQTKRGKTFYGCERYPKCDFATWDTPVEGPCPNCDSPTLIEKNTKSKNFKYCHRCDWKSEG